MKNDLTRIFCSVLALTILAGPGIVRAQEVHSQSAISSELAEMHRADQADRQSPINWGVVSPRDLQRRGRVLEIIGEEKLATAEDHYHAAMVLQHSSPGSKGYSVQLYLLAHALATVAGFKGHEEARWLSAAALDRYFFWMRQPQFFGVQYEKDNNDQWQPGPYSSFLTPALEKEFGLPARVEKDSNKNEQPAPPFSSKAQTAIGSELAEMHRADQEDRSTGRVTGGKLAERDRQRRIRTMEILRQGALATAEDYYHAAVIFQHSNPAAEDYTPQQYLLAHALAMLAGFKGHEQAKWLSAAALDRYLTFTKQEQFFGTQYVRDNNNLWRPGDYSRMLTGKLRREFGLNAEEMQKRAESFNKPQP